MKKKSKKKSYPKSTALWRFLFVVYVGVMLWLLFGRSSGWGSKLTYAQQLRRNMSLVPFHTIGNYWRVVSRWEWDYLFRHCFINLVGNVVLFIPAGYLLPRLWKTFRNFFAFLLTCVLAISLVELLQLVTLLGSLDIDDLILNLCGMILGYITFMIIKK